MNSAFSSPVASVLASFALAHALVAIGRAGRFGMDIPGHIQTFHLAPTPRLGGIGLYLAVAIARGFLGSSPAGAILDVILVAGLAALGAGLIEDFTRRTGVRLRLLATAASGVMACWLASTAIGSIGIPAADELLRWSPVAIAFTTVAIAGLANAINMIDGFNGLASGTTAIALSAFATIAALEGDSSLALSATVLAGAVVGFALVNFPWGKLFLGDGGAYFAGFALAWVAVLLPSRNPGVSPWASLLVCAYPVIEVFYSMARRWYARTGATVADRGHLHSLVAVRLVHKRLPHLHPTLQNSAVAALMWSCASFPALLAVTFYSSTKWLAIGTAGSVLLYHWLYRRVARS